MRRYRRTKYLDVDASVLTDGTVTFRYPILLRYVLRGALPAIATTLFLFSLSNGWSSDNLVFGAFCAAISLPWWWAFRRYGLTITVDSEGIHFIRGRKSTLAGWTAVSAIQFSVSSVSIAANGKRWYVLSDLSGWDQFERLLRDRASSEALAARLKPPFCIRKKWAGVIQPGIFCVALLIGGISQFATGQWKAGLVILAVGGLFLFLLRGTVLWYRFDEDALFVQRLIGRERYPWSNLQFATVKEAVLAMSFASECLVAIDGSQIARSIEDIFLSMQPFWEKHASSKALCAERQNPIWSWAAAAFWWTIVPVLMLVTFPEVISSIRVKLGAGAYVCESIARPEDVCQTLHHVRAFLRFDIAVLALMFVVVAGIYCAGENCNRRRERLLSIFRPTLALTITGTILILAAQSALLAALLYYVPLELANIRLTGLLITVTIGLVLGLYHVVRNTWSAVRLAPLELNAVSVLHIEQPELWNVVSSIAQRLGVPRPDNILLGLEPNYFATESHICLEAAQADGYSLYISIPATRIMTEPELRAVIGHEFGHFRGADTAFTKRFFPPYNSAVKAVAAMANAPGSWSLLPAIYMLHFFLVSFGKVQSALSRDREFLADNAGAEASSPLDLASALVKLELFAPRIFALVQERVHTDRATTAIGEQIHFTWPTIIPESLLEARTPHPFDSHPALGKRLENLKIDLNTVLATPIAQDAAQIFHTPDALEARLLAEMRAKSEASKLSGKFTFVPNLPN